MNMILRNAKPSDAISISKIYNYYVHNSIATFDEEEVAQAEFIQKIESSDQTHPFFVAEQEGVIMGYAYAAMWNSRSAYRFSCMSSIYIHPEHQGKGLGRKLYQHLFDHLAEHTVFKRIVAGISLPNPASEKLHASFGFKPAGVHEKIGYKFGKWIDVGYYIKNMD